jgi:hypothetical protein
LEEPITVDTILIAVSVILLALTFALIPERLLWISGALRRLLRLPWHSREFVESLKPSDEAGTGTPKRAALWRGYYWPESNRRLIWTYRLVGIATALMLTLVLLSGNVTRLDRP